MTTAVLFVLIVFALIVYIGRTIQAPESPLVPATNSRLLRDFLIGILIIRRVSQCYAELIERYLRG